MTLPYGWPGQFLAIALLIVPPAVLGTVVLRPVWGHYQQLHSARDTALQDLQRLRTLAGRLPALRRAATALRAEDPLAPYLIPAENSALAAARIQRRLRSAVQGLGGDVLSTRVLGTEAQTALERITIDARLKLSLAGLQRLLYELQTRPPLLTVDALAVLDRAAGRRGRQAVDDRLEITLDLTGRRLRDPDRLGIADE